jgi:hypothetical protein
MTVAPRVPGAGYVGLFDGRRCFNDAEAARFDASMRRARRVVAVGREAGRLGREYADGLARRPPWWRR